MLVPKLRFKEFKNEWKKYRIGDTLKVKSGRDQKLVECINGKYPILGTGGQIGTTNSFLYDKPSVLIGRKGTIDKPQYMTIPFWTVDTLFYTDIKNGFNTKYIFYAFQNINWKKYDESTGVPSLSCKTIEEISYYIPNNDEQEKIAKFLTLLDKKIDLQKQKIEALKIYKIGLIKQIFNMDNINSKNYSIAECINIFDEKTTINNQYTILSSTKNGLQIQDDYFNRQTASENNIGYRIIPKNYITYRSMSDTGNFYFNLQNIVEFGIVSPAYPVFNTNNFVDIYYFLYYLNYSNNVKKQILLNKEGGTRFALSISKLSNIRIFLPSYETQVNHSYILVLLDKKINIEKQKLNKLNALKKSLLQQMFI